MTQTLKDLRKNAPYTVQQIADHMQVSVRTIYLWEKAERNIDAQTLHKLMALYQADAPISQIATLIPAKPSVTT